MFAKINIVFYSYGWAELLIVVSDLCCYGCIFSYYDVLSYINIVTSIYLYSWPYCYVFAAGLYAVMYEPSIYGAIDVTCRFQQKTKRLHKVSYYLFHNPFALP